MHEEGHVRWYYLIISVSVSDFFHNCDFGCVVRFGDMYMCSILSKNQATYFLYELAYAYAYAYAFNYFERRPLSPLSPA